MAKKLLDIRFIMQVLQYSKARNNLRDIINRVCDDYDEYLITTKDEKTAVLISYEEYSTMKEISFKYKGK